MIRGLPTTIFCTLLAGVVGVGLFFVKHEVKEQEARLSELNQEIERNQEAIHVLKAEWSYLNDPARLRALSEKFLSMKVMGAAQVASLDSLPRGTSGSGPVYAEAEQPRPPVRVAAAISAPAPQPAPQNHAAPAVRPATSHAPAVAEAKPLSAPAKQTIAKAPATVPVRVAATPAPQDQYRPPAPQTQYHPVQQPTPVRPATTAPQPQPGRSIVIQSPALASTPALPGDPR